MMSMAGCPPVPPGMWCCCGRSPPWKGSGDPKRLLLLAVTRCSPGCALQVHAWSYASSPKPSKAFSHHLFCRIDLHEIGFIKEMAIITHLPVDNYRELQDLESPKQSSPEALLV